MINEMYMFILGVFEIWEFINVWVVMYFVAALTL
jgi:hypothetical protein